MRKRSSIFCLLVSVNIYENCQLEYECHKIILRRFLHSFSTALFNGKSNKLKTGAKKQLVFHNNMYNCFHAKFK